MSISPTTIREEVNELIHHSQKESTNIFDCQLLLGLALSIAKEMGMKLYETFALKELPGYQRIGQEETVKVWKLVFCTLCSSIGIPDGYYQATSLVNTEDLPFRKDIHCCPRLCT